MAKPGKKKKVLWCLVLFYRAFILCIMIIEGIVVCLWGLIILQKNRLKQRQQDV